MSNLNTHRVSGSRYLAQLIITVIFHFSLISDCIGSATTQRPLSELSGIKALFDENYHWITKQGADQLIEDAKKAGFNVIIPCVWHGRGASWNSALAPIDSKLPAAQIRENDPLGYLINTAHQNGLQVHPWVTVFKRELDFLPQYADPSTKKFFNIHDPGYIEFISNVTLELAQRYNIDGLNLDYVRSTGVCDRLSCINDYKQKTGRDFKLDAATSFVLPAAKQALISWRIGAITNGIKAINTKVRAVKPNQIISVDTIVNDDIWYSYGADGIRWLNQGLIDVVFHMDYRTTLLKNVISGAMAKIIEPERLLILISNVDLPPEKITPRTRYQVESLLGQVANLSVNQNSYGFYEYKFLTKFQLPAIKTFNIMPPLSPANITASQLNQ